MLKELPKTLLDPNGAWRMKKRCGCERKNKRNDGKSVSTAIVLSKS
jgi:hypothetical protein